MFRPCQPVFDRYNIFSDRDLKEALSKTAAYVEALPSKASGIPIEETISR